MKKTIGFIIFIALVSIFACNKDNDDVTNDAFTQAGVEEWFNTTFKESKEWQQNADSQNKLPDWSNGTYLKKNGIEIFEVPLMENKTTITVPQDKSITDKDAKKILEATLLRMVIIKTDKNEMIVRKLYYVPEYKYLLSKGYDISNVMLNKPNDDFTGLLITKKWNDEVLSFHRVKNGKIKDQLVKYDANAAKNNPLNRINMKSYATARISGLDDEQNLDEVVITNTYHAPVTYIYYNFSQPYFPNISPTTTYDPYGMNYYGDGSSGSGSWQNETDICNNDLSSLENSSYSTSTLKLSKIIAESIVDRTKNYEWTIFKGPGYELNSTETAVHKKVANIDPNLQWEFVSLKHNQVVRNGIVLGGDITYSEIYAQSTIGKYNAIMDIKYNVAFSIACKAGPAVSSNTYNSIHNFNIND